jgi:hypothetical protein
MKKRKSCLMLLLGLAMLLTEACSAIEAPDAAGPRATAPLYPIQLVDDGQRAEAAMVAWRQLAQQSGIPDDAEITLHPVTATVLNLSPEATLYLPKVGAGEEMTEEELRESLRRFINGWQRLIGAEPAQLSLVEREDLPDKTSVARYEQRPFRYPLRGEFGHLRIHFGPGRRVLQLSSTCIPEAEQIQTRIASVEPQISREEADTRLRNRELSLTNTEGRMQTFTVPQSADIDVETLVIYGRATVGQNGGLEFRVAWEINLAGAPIKIVYLDAVNGEILGVV